MRSRLFLCAIVIVALIPTACKSGGDSGPKTYKNSVLPATLAIKLPDSLAPAGAKGLRATSRSGGGGYDAESAGYSQVTNAVESMKEMQPALVMFGIVVDAAISQNHLSAGSYGSQSVTLTEDMYNAINAQLPDSGAIDKSAIGTSQTIASVVYSTSGTGTFQYSFSFSDPEDSTCQIKYEWSSDRTKLKMSIGAASDSLAITFDASTNSCAFNIGGGTLTYSMAVQSDSSNSGKNGVYVYETSGMTGLYSYTVSGYADDDGGLIQSKYDMPSASPPTYYYKEGFDQSGALLYAMWGTGSPDNPTGYSNSTPVTKYGAKADTAGVPGNYGAIGL